MKGKVYMDASLIIKRDLYLNKKINGLLFHRKTRCVLHICSQFLFGNSIYNCNEIVCSNNVVVI